MFLFSYLIFQNYIILILVFILGDQNVLFLAIIFI